MNILRNLTGTFRFVVTSLVTPFIFFSLHAQTPNSWVQKADFGGIGRVQASSFSIGTKCYFGVGGVTSSVRKDFWEWDQQTNTWTQIADFGGAARNETAAFSIGTKGYIGLGSDGSSYQKDFWEWDQASNTWSRKADFGGTARIASRCFSIGNKGYVGTGADINGLQKDLWEWDQQSNTWTRKADFGGTARETDVAFSIGNKGYIGTGFDNSFFTKDFWEWDQQTNTWTQKADFGGIGRYAACGFSIGNKGYIGTGSNVTDLNDLWEWDPVTDMWTQVADLAGVPRSFAVSTSIGSKGYIGTAGSTGSEADFWEYTPVYTPDTSVQNGNWNDTTTWQNKIIPSFVENVVITAGDTVNVNVNSSVNNLTIVNGATLIINDTTTLIVAGTFSNSGTIEGPGTIEFYAPDTIPTGNGSGGVFSDPLLNLSADANVALAIPLTFKNVTVAERDTLNIGVNDLTILGDATLNGYIYGDSSTYFSGTTGQKIFGYNGTISNLVINDTAGVTLDPTNLNIGNSLTFLNGNLNTDTDQVLTNYTSSIISSSSTGWINGTLELNGLPVAGDASMRFEVGGAAWYDPVDLDLHGLSGTSGSFRASTFTGSAAKAEIASSPLDTSKSVMRTWTISNLGASFTDFDLTLNYNTGEIPLAATQSQFVIAQTDDGGTHWTLDIGSTTGSGTQSVGLIYNSNFIVGEVDCNRLLSSVSTSVTDVSSVGGNDGAITITTNKGYGPFKYQWSVNDSAFSRNDTTLVINNLTIGTYIVRVTSVGQCSGAIDKTIGLRSAEQVSEIGKENNICIFPNPAHDKLNIDFKGSYNTNHLITFYDITGRAVSKQLVNAGGKSNQIAELDISMLSKGFYIVRLDSSTMTGQVRVLVE